MVRTRRWSTTTGGAKSVASVTVDETHHSDADNDDDDTRTLRRSTRHKATIVTTDAMGGRRVTPSPRIRDREGRSNNDEEFTGSSSTSTTSPATLLSPTRKSLTAEKSPASRKLFPRKKKPSFSRMLARTKTAFSGHDDADMLSLASACVSVLFSPQRKTSPSRPDHTTNRQKSLQANRKRRMLTCSIDSLALASAPVMSPTKSEASMFTSTNPAPPRRTKQQGKHRVSDMEVERESTVQLPATTTIAVTRVTLTRGTKTSANPNATTTTKVLTPPGGKDVLRENYSNATSTSSEVAAATIATMARRKTAGIETKKSNHATTAPNDVTAGTSRPTVAKEKNNVTEPSRDDMESKTSSQASRNSDTACNGCDNSVSSPMHGESLAQPRSVPLELVRLLAPAAGPVPASLRPSSTSHRFNVPTSGGASRWKRSNFGDGDDGSDRDAKTEGGEASPSLPSLRPRAKLPYTPRGYSYFQESNDNSSSGSEIISRKRTNESPKATTAAASTPKRGRGRPRKQAVPADVLNEKEVTSAVPPTNSKQDLSPKKASPVNTGTGEMAPVVRKITTRRGRGKPPKFAASDNHGKEQQVSPSSPRNEASPRVANAGTKSPVDMVVFAESGMAKPPKTKPVQSVLAVTDAHRKKPGRPSKNKEINVSHDNPVDERPFKRRRHLEGAKTSNTTATDKETGPPAEKKSISNVATNPKQKPLSRLGGCSRDIDSERQPVKRRGQSRKDEMRGRLDTSEKDESNLEPSTVVAHRRSNEHGKNAVLGPTMSPVTKSVTNLPKAPRSPVRRRRETEDPTRVCHFDSASKKLIIDTASVPESVVNAITSQVQACLNQAKSPAGFSLQGLNQTTLAPRGLNLPRTGASNRNDMRDEAEDEGQGMLILGFRDHGFDSKSVTSELTNDFSRIGYHGGSTTVPLNMNRRQIRRTRNDEDDDGFMAGGIIDDDEVSADVRDHSEAKSSSEKVTAAQTKPLAQTSLHDDTRSMTSSRRRRTFWNCSDSLAGSQSGLSRRRSKETKIPQEVPVKKPSPPLLHQADVSDATLKKAAQGIPCQKEVSEVMEHAKLTDAKSSSRIRIGDSYCCGRCSGCLRERDCQTCENCLSKLRRFGTMPPPMGEHEGCLKRRCQKARLVGRSDILLGGLSSVAGESTETNDQRTTLQPKLAQSSLHEQEIGRLHDSHRHDTSEETEDAPKSGAALELKNTSRAAEQDDDWSVDYSYLSEADYRHQLNRKYWRPSSSRRHSSVSSVSSKRSWLFPFSRKLTGNQRRPRSSLCSSVSSKKTITPHTRVLGAATTTNSTPPHQDSSKRRGSKRQRDPLYDMSLLQPPKNRKKAATTILSPLEAWTDTPTSLQAMVQYDEKDQDWV